MRPISDEILDPRYGTKTSHVQGVINSVTTTTLSGGKTLAVFDVRDSTTREIQKVAVWNDDVLKQIGVGPYKNAAPPQGLLVNFRVDRDEGDEFIVGKGLDKPTIGLSRGEPLRADGRNIVPAVVRTGLRIGMSEMQQAAKLLADPKDRSTHRYLENLRKSWSNYIGVMERRLGGDSERDAMQKVLRDAVEVFSQIKRSSGIDQNDEASFPSRMELASKELLFALREARNEATYDDEVLISNSKAIELVAPEGMNFRQKMAATVLWAAHNTIKAEDKIGAMGYELEGIQSALIRYRKAGTDGEKDLIVGLKRAGKTLTDMKERFANDPILSSSIEAAFQNVKEAYRWVANHKKPLDVGIDLEQQLLGQLSKEFGKDPRMLVFGEIIAQELSEGNKIVGQFEGDKKNPNVRRAIEFAGGETLQIDKKGNIVMHDSDKMLALVDRPGQERRYFVEGKLEGRAERVSEQTASLAFETTSAHQFAA